ncbi:uncharacterized protein LOC124403755 [Silurus meridionalis]|uniref:Uncharacterized protein n=1 Tax=Silurus meridionalis TaxID=175797 RepID=A0A8T0AI09_SILME|nr:uncharacterized protein LOC124403755 [Silurus meridionalis]XP_046733452.1 uncharacterized protein LOC124403755 [Silurus meridionalis]KAF7692036.1 hypothetical protein HF521_011003 [Silurus meridionalis]
MTSFEESYLIAVEKWILENQEEIEKAAEILGESSDFLLTTVGQVFPLVKYFYVFTAKLLGNPNSYEDTYFTKQFQNVNRKLNEIKENMHEVERITMRSSLNMQMFKYEAQIKFQYKMFMKIFTSESNKKLKIKEFVMMFENADDEQNLNGLYDQVTGNNMSGRAMLDEIVQTEHPSRRAVVEFCAYLKKLFVFGIIALIGYTAIKKGDAGEDMVKKWQTRMEDVEKHMKAAVGESE